MLDLHLPRIYPITDTEISGLPHDAQVEKLINGGARIIQLREKRASSADFYLAAKLSVGLARERGVLIIINDRVDIALATGADGVHLGQEDMPVEKARDILGEKAIIGLSTHSVEQLRDSLDAPVDYVAYGPVFDTRTKENPDPVVGTEGLRIARKLIGRIPLVAIGGISEENISDVIVAGADSAAVISSVLAGPASIEENIGRLLSRVH